MITTEVCSPQVRKRANRKSSLAMLSTCPVNGAGWCPYPFSPAQLQRRLKAKMVAIDPSSSAPVVAGKKNAKASSSKSK